MQKLLMKRLEQQDDYFNRCMFGKQSEIDDLQRKLSTAQSEIANLALSLRLSQEEVRRQGKFLQYYPKFSICEENMPLDILPAIKERFGSVL